GRPRRAASGRRGAAGDRPRRDDGGRAGAAVAARAPRGREAQVDQLDRMAGPVAVAAQVLAPERLGQLGEGATVRPPALASGARPSSGGSGTVSSNDWPT